MSDDERPNVEILPDEGDGDPTEEEVREYAEFLGIDPDTEPELLWIAKEGVVAPVPSPWKACQEGDEVFYFNFETECSIWDHPMDSHFRELLEKERKKLGAAPPVPDDEDDDKSFVSEAVDSDAGVSPNASRSGSPAAATAASPSGAKVPSPSGSSAAVDVARPSGSKAAAKVAGVAGAAVGDADGLDAGGNADADNDASFVSEAVASDTELSSPSASPTGGAVAAAAGNITQDSKSFISDVVTSEANTSYAADGPASSTAGASTNNAQETSSFISEAVSCDAASATSPTTATAQNLSTKDQAALWKSMSGGTTTSTPRSRSSSRSSSPHAANAISTAPEAANSPSQSSGSHQGSQRSSPRSASSHNGSPSASPVAAKATAPLAVASAPLAEVATSPAEVTTSPEAAAPAQTSPAAVVAPAFVGIGAAAQQSPTGIGAGLLRSPPLSANSSPLGSHSMSSTAKSGNASGGVGDSGRSPMTSLVSSPGGGLPQISPKASPADTTRPRPVLDIGACGSHSARSSNPSEISEDFRSDFGLASPPLSARGDNMGQSLELSATASMDASDRQLTCVTKGLVDGKPSPELSPIRKPVVIEGAPKSWQTLSLDLQSLAEALIGMKMIRSKQHEYLQHLKLDS